MSKPGPTFLPEVYKLSLTAKDRKGSLEIQGQKLGPPNKRITLNQKGLKIVGARIIYSQKNKKVEHQVTRINHLPSREEVRLHTNSPLYPGSYQIDLEFSPADVQALAKLAGKDVEDINLRSFIPSFDRVEAKKNVRLEIEG